MNRKQRRAKDAKIKKDGNEELAAQVAMFGKLPEECTACTSPYDKTDKEMATTWNIVIRDKNTVRLYCPQCWEAAQKIIKEFKERKNDE